MHDFFAALGHLLWHSLLGLVGGWLGTTILALAVGAMNYFVGPWIDALLYGQQSEKPKLTGSLAITLVTWVLLFSFSLVHTIYADHVTLVSQDQSLRVQNTSDDDEIKRLRGDNALLKEKLSPFTETEPPDSLRRRTMKLSDELYSFLIKRSQGHPPNAYPDSSDPNPSEERMKMIQACQKYDQETTDYYLKHFKDRMVGIIKEYNAIGVVTGFLEATAARQPPNYAWPGSGWEGSPIDDLSRFRDLAYRVDAKDKLITF